MPRFTVRINELPSPASIAALGDSMRAQNGFDAPAMRALAAVIDRVSSPRIDARYVIAAMREIDAVGGVDATFVRFGWVAASISHAADTVSHRMAYAESCRMAGVTARWADGDVAKDKSVMFKPFSSGSAWAQPGMTDGFVTKAETEWIMSVFA